MSPFNHRILTCTGLLFCSTLAACNASRPALSPSSHMAPLHAWIGQWKGSGWMVNQDGSRIDFENSENIESRCGGDVLIMEGSGVQILPDGKTIILHKGFTMITRNSASGAFHWHGHEAARSDGDIESELLLADGHATWSLQRGPATVRFTITVNDNHWLETGEASTDGQQWSHFMKCDMHRISSQ